MKNYHISLLALLLYLPFGAQNIALADKTTGSSDAADVVEIPTEISEPPYQLGNLVTEQGYYIERGDEKPRINLRFVGNKLRVYWIDENGLIAEPEYSSAVVRFTGSVRGRDYFSLSTLPSGVGLGSPAIIVPPHLYNIILVFPAPEDGDPTTYTFRYTQSMDVAVDPTKSAD